MPTPSGQEEIEPMRICRQNSEIKKIPASLEHGNVALFSSDMNLLQMAGLSIFQ